MPVKMSTKSGGKMKKLKSRLSKEYEFLKGVFSVLNLPANRDDENADYEIVVNTKQEKEDNQLPNRARSITELEEKLQKIKSQHTFNLKNKLVKKSLSSKLNKKLKKKERKDMKRNLNKAYKKPKDEKSIDEEQSIKEEKVKMNSETPKPVYNMDSKLVFSKFDFSNMGQGGKQRHNTKDPKKLLADLKDQEQKFKELSNNDEEGKVKQIKEKIAWKTVLQKAEGEKVKDDPTLLKKSIKKMEQKKKSSKKKWDERVQNVAEKKDERQKKRRENISKKKKDKKAKVVKAAVKRGRVVI